MHQFRLLGPLELVVAGKVAPVTRRRERELLALLVLNAGRGVSDQRILDELWPGAPPDRALHALRTTASRLRGALAPGQADVLTRAAGGYRIDPAPGSVDSSRFVGLVGEATRSSDPGVRAALLRDALNLWRGPALVELSDLEFARSAAARLEEQRIDALEALLTARHELGENRSLVAGLEQLVSEHPLREGLWAVLVLALDAAGRSGEAARACDRARRALSTIGIEPGLRLREAERSIRHPVEDVEVATGPAPGRSTGDLPAPSTRFVGRRAELDDIVSVLDTDRLVTLTGPAGVGKSRLAIEAARAAAASFDEGARLADLRGIDDLRAATSLIGTATGWWPASAPDEASDALEPWLGVLRSRQVLLILDNCDDVPDLGELVGRIVSICPRVVVVATSRVRLGATGEVVRRIAPLALRPSSDGSGPGEAVELFADRARSVSPGFELDHENLPLVTDLVTRMDGLPLAIELVASWTEALPLTEMSRRLASLLRVGSAARGVDMPASLVSCYDGLSLADRAVFDAVSVLGSSWTIETAEAMCDPGDVAASLGHLVDHSVLELEPGHGVAARYRMLRLTRALGRSHLRADGRLPAMRSRHARHFATQLHDRLGELWGRSSGPTLQWFQRALEDLDAAHRWLVSSDPHSADGMAAAAAWFWIELGYPSAAAESRLRTGAGGDGPSSAEASLAQAAVEALRLPTLGRRFGLPVVACHDRFGLARAPVPPPGAHRQLAERALELFGDAGDAGGIVSAQLAVAMALGCDGRYSSAMELAAPIRSRFVDNPWALAMVDLLLANLALGDADGQRASAAAARARSFLRDDHLLPVLNAWSLDTDARIAWTDGRMDDAVAHWSAVLDVGAAHHPRRVVTRVLIALAQMARGDHDEARTLLDRALAEGMRIGLDATLSDVRCAQALLAADLGELATARALLDDGGPRAGVAQGSPPGPSSLLAALTALDGDYDASTRHALACLRAPGAAYDHLALAGAFEALAACAATEGRLRRVAMLAGAADSVRAACFLPRSQLSTRVVEIAESRLEHRAGPGDRDEARRLGTAIELESAIDYALSGRDTPATDLAVEAAVA